ncbi:MerR family transcriptional regulator [Isoalcanivorax indicus]|uniref:MerR family transcriptional regulator n=1 Tax=Isoalcanivorax indicus TaxID=2202653 RepID=UPI000DB9ACED|nr:MerR family transcriptional regulator [Isoalcanivorax indicus]
MSAAAEPLLSISAAGALTGVNPVTLRAWERRYGLLRPHRTEQGHRLYRDADVQRIRQIVLWLDKGVAISRVRPLLDAERPDMTDIAPDWAEAVEAGRQAAMALAPHRLEQQFNRLASEYPLARVFSHWLAPLRATLKAQAALPGACAASGVLETFVRAKLGTRLLAAQRRAGRTPRWVILPMGQGTALAPLMLAALCGEADLPCILLPGMPPAETLRVLAHRQDVQGLLLVLPADITVTLLRRGLGAAARHLHGRLWACGEGLLTLNSLPEGLVALSGDMDTVVQKLARQQGGAS